MELPWPPSALLPNRRNGKSWRGTFKTVQTYRASVATLVAEELQRSGKPGLLGDLVLDLTFYPPDRRRRDRDGMLSSFKAGIDGLAMGGGGLPGLDVDDYRFGEIRFRVGQVRPPGAVLARVAVDVRSELAAIGLAE